jgi:Lar family restriction alleviation protein
MSELLSCPFCGGEAETFNPFGTSDGTWTVLCSECASSVGFEQTEAEAIAAWNTRADYHGYEQAAIEAWESIKAWNARADSYTREDVESAFVSGYSLGTLPVGSDPRWDQNETTLEEEMEELGWVRKRTCQRFWTGAEMICSSCAHQLNDKTANYCPNCGSRVVG